MLRTDPKADLCELSFPVYLQSDFTDQRTIALDDRVEADIIAGLYGGSGDPGICEFARRNRRHRVPLCDLGVIPRRDKRVNIGSSPRPKSQARNRIDHGTNLRHGSTRHELYSLRCNEPNLTRIPLMNGAERSVEYSLASATASDTTAVVGTSGL